MIPLHAIGAAIWESSRFGAAVWDVGERAPGNEVLLGLNAHAATQSGADFSHRVGATMAEEFPPLVGSPVHDAIRVAAAGGVPESVTVPYGDDEIPAGYFDVFVLPVEHARALVLYVNVTEREALRHRLEVRTVELQAEVDSLRATVESLALRLEALESM